jgi:anti-sigma B factor antagonist
MEPLRVTTARFGADSYVVSLAGELDLGTSEQFAHELDALRERGARQLIVDLLGITFLGSAGLALLTRAAKQTRAVGGECVVVSDDPRTLRVFQITGLERSFRIERSLMEAVGELAGARAVA